MTDALPNLAMSARPTASVNQGRWQEPQGKVAFLMASSPIAFAASPDDITAMPNCTAGEMKSRRLNVTIPCARPFTCDRPGGRFSSCSSSAAATLSIDYNTSGSM